METGGFISKKELKALPGIQFYLHVGLPGDVVFMIGMGR